MYLRCGIYTKICMYNVQYSSKLSITIIIIRLYIMMAKILMMYCIIMHIIICK